MMAPLRLATARCNDRLICLQNNGEICQVSIWPWPEKRAFKYWLRGQKPLEEIEFSGSHALALASKTWAGYVDIIAQELIATTEMSISKSQKSTWQIGLADRRTGLELHSIPELTEVRPVLNPDSVPDLWEWTQVSKPVRRILPGPQGRQTLGHAFAQWLTKVAERCRAGQDILVWSTDIEKFPAKITSFTPG